MKARFWIFMSALLLVFAQRAAAVEIWFCDGGCLCIAWPTPIGERLEIRCGSGGGTAPPGYTTIPPTWGGTGTVPPAGTAPGNPLPMSPVNLAGYVSTANQTAQVRAKGDKDPYSTFWIPDECTALFNNSPLGMNGYSLLNSYIKYRHGEGLQDANGNVPCSNGAAAWTTCCDHKPYVFICNSFANLSASERANVLIHEAMHVAGQLEDKTGTVSGPGDPPSPAQIQDKVRTVCD